MTLNLQITKEKNLPVIHANDEPPISFSKLLKLASRILDQAIKS